MMWGEQNRLEAISQRPGYDLTGHIALDRMSGWDGSLVRPFQEISNWSAPSEEFWPFLDDEISPAQSNATMEE